MTEVRGGVRTSSTVRSFDLERGLPEGGSYFAAVIKPNIPSAAENRDGFRAMQKHALEIVRQELGQMDCGFGIRVRRREVRGGRVYAGVSAGRGQTVLHQDTQGDRKQRDLFCDIRAAVYLAVGRAPQKKLSVSLKEALYCASTVCATHQTGGTPKPKHRIFPCIIRWTARRSVAFRRLPHV